MISNFTKFDSNNVVVDGILSPKERKLLEGLSNISESFLRGEDMKNLYDKLKKDYRRIISNGNIDKKDLSLFDTVFNRMENILQIGPENSKENISILVSNKLYKDLVDLFYNINDRIKDRFFPLKSIKERILSDKFEGLNYFLALLGYKKGTLEDRIKSFQKDHGLEVNGVFGNSTGRKMKFILENILRGIDKKIDDTRNKISKSTLKTPKSISKTPKSISSSTIPFGSDVTIKSTCEGDGCNEVGGNSGVKINGHIF